MSPFQIQSGHFWLDGRPRLLQAGELHYFRIPADQWAHRLSLLRQAGFDAVASYIPWLWHEPAEGRFDFDGHSHPMRNLAGFLDLAARLGFLVIARPGPYIMAETINEGIPPWVFERYPQVALVDQTGAAQNIASPLHPDFRALARRWYQAVFAVLAPRQIGRRGSIVLVQLDNEMGMLHWVRNLVDLNPDTLARFAEWLRQADDGRRAARYPAEPTPDLLREALADGHSALAGQALADYRRFCRTYWRDYFAFLTETARACGLEVPPVLNIHGFANGGKTFPIGLSQLVEAMALPGVVSATDVYPLFIGEGNFHQLLLVNEMTKAVQNPEQPLFSIEFQAGGNNDFSGAQASFYDLHTRLCISCGLRGVNHYLFFDGENHPLLSPVKRHDWGHPVRVDGTTRNHFPRYGRLSRTLAAYGEALVRSRPRTVTTVGFLLDDFMTEVNLPATRREAEVLTHQREVILFDFIGRGLALTHRPFNAVELSRAALDPATTPTLWAMVERRWDAAVQAKVVDYVQRGGRLALVGRLCQEDGDGGPCTLLRDALGVVEVRGGEPFRAETIAAFGYTDIPASFVETYEGPFDAVFATAAGGGVTGFVRRLGAGQVVMLGAALVANALEDLALVHRMAWLLGVPPLFALNRWVDVRLSEGEAGSFLFVNNYAEEPVETAVACAGRPLFDGRPIRLPPRRGAILPLEWRVAPDVDAIVHYLTAEVVEVQRQAGRLVLRTDPARAWAEVSVAGRRRAVRITDGVLVLEG
ncbi:MAG: beta-galactosidase [Anaerolineae bacterium]|nr:beta-galactosidase [Anaerolineae bacterium]